MGLVSLGTVKGLDFIKDGQPRRPKSRASPEQEPSSTERWFLTQFSSTKATSARRVADSSMEAEVHKMSPAIFKKRKGKKDKKDLKDIGPDPTDRARTI